MFEDTNLELNSGNRYGLLGANGCGKSTMLTCLGHREVPIPEHIDIFYLDREMPPSDKTPLESVMDVDQERVKLEKEAERLMHEDRKFKFVTGTRVALIHNNNRKTLECL